MNVLMPGVRLHENDMIQPASRPPPSLKIGSHVSIQNHNRGLWDRSGVIVAIGRFRTYLIRFDSGRLLWRNRLYLRGLKIGKSVTNQPVNSHFLTPSFLESIPCFGFTRHSRAMLQVSSHNFAPHFQTLLPKTQYFLDSNSLTLYNR